MAEGTLCHSFSCRQSAFEIFHAGLEEGLVFISADIFGNVLAAPFGVAHLAQHSAVGTGDAFHSPGGTVGAEAMKRPSPWLMAML